MANQQPGLPPEVIRRAAAKRAAIRWAAAAQRRGQQRRPRPPMRRRPRTGTPRRGMESMLGYGVMGGIGLAILVAIVVAVGGNQTRPDSKAPDTGGNKGACANAADGPKLTRFLQALALQESGGRPYAAENGIAYGKYQYIDSTWHATAQKYYPPADNYGHASQAPEEYQDAVAYIEYSVKYRDFGGDLTKMAVSHYFPGALKEAWLMDVIPFPDAGNVLTPRQYAERFIQKMESGAGSNIPIKASSAPDFEKHLARVGGKC